MIAGRGPAISGGLEGGLPHGVTPRKRAQRGSVDSVATRAESLEGLVDVVLRNPAEERVPSGAVPHYLGLVRGTRPCDSELLDVAREHAERAATRVERRFDGSVEVFVQPAPDGRNLRQGEDKGVPVAGVAEIP